MFREKLLEDEDITYDLEGDTVLVVTDGKVFPYVATKEDYTEEEIIDMLVREGLFGFEYLEHSEENSTDECRIFHVHGVKL